MTQQEAEQLLGYQLTPGWFFHAIRRGDELAGFVMQKGSELHVWRKPDFVGRWLMRGEIDRILTATIAEYGKATSKTKADNQTGQTFLKRMGFEEVSNNGQIIEFECKRPRHARL